MERLRARWPVLASELHAALVAEGWDSLAGQVDGLAVVRECDCRDGFCQSFYTAPPPDGAWGPGHHTVMLDAPWPGMLILDVVNDMITFVEVLFRPARLN